jgi:chromosome condensin MukBEF complex kleisin-like MukF subunit
MTDIPSQNFDLYADRLMLFSELRLSYSHALETFHRAKHYATFRIILEQMAEGGRSNADFAAWAKKILADEKADRPKIKRRSKPLVKLEGVP